MADEPDNLVLQLLRQIRVEMATKAELADMKAELKSDIASLRADFATMQAKTDGEFKQVREQIVGLRRAVVEYHSPSSAMAS